jgi:hypothetical protein
MIPASAIASPAAGADGLLRQEPVEHHQHGEEQHRLEQERRQEAGPGAHA